MLDAGEKGQVEPQDEEEAVEDDHILDFERIFSSECASAVAVNTSNDTSEKCTEESLAGLEGIGSRVYFEAYGKLLLGGFEFSKREYYPPPDPVNALLSFGYMLLFNELSSLLEASGFDVFLGFLHSTKYGRASLATDMMEEFRSPIADRFVIYRLSDNSFHKARGRTSSKTYMLVRRREVRPITQ